MKNVLYIFSPEIECCLLGPDNFTGYKGTIQEEGGIMEEGTDENSGMSTAVKSPEFFRWEKILYIDFFYYYFRFSTSNF